MHGLQPCLSRFAIADLVALQQFGFENRTRHKGMPVWLFRVFEGDRS
jgi:hypothetical protein